MKTEKVDMKTIKKERCTITLVSNLSPVMDRITVWVGNQFGEKEQLLIDTFCHQKELVDEITNNYLSININNDKLFFYKDF